MNNFGNGPLDEATSQISKTWAFWFQTRRFLKVFADFHLFVAKAVFCYDSKSLNNFQLVPPKDHSSEVWSKLAQWFRRKHQLLTDDGQQRTGLSEELTEHMCSGELKIQNFAYISCIKDPFKYEMSP